MEGWSSISGGLGRQIRDWHPGQLQLSGELRQNSDATRLGVAYHVAGPDSSRTLQTPSFRQLCHIFSPKLMTSKGQSPSQVFVGRTSILYIHHWRDKCHPRPSELCGEAQWGLARSQLQNIRGCMARMPWMMGEAGWGGFWMGDSLGVH